MSSGMVALDFLADKGILPFGKPVYIKTVTHYYTGELVTMTPQWIVIRNSARIITDAPQGRHEHEFAAGEVDPQESEYMGPGYKFIGVGAVVEFQEIKKLVLATV